MKLPRDFYERPDVVTIARELLGKVLCTNIEGHYSAARITELEAYAGRDDKACHANDGLRTNRTEAMYGRGGTTYVYLCYGIHHLFNVVTNSEGLADAILIRAVEPVVGLEVMMGRRNKARPDKTLSSGPGTLSQALGIKTNLHYGLDLLGNTIWIEDAPLLYSKDIVISKRIGVDYAEEDALRPWRFYVRGNKWVSKKLAGDR